MKKFQLEKDIPVIYVPAVSFPEGIETAFQKLRSSVDDKNERTFFGISWADKLGKIVYKAAVEEKSKGEAEKYGLGSFIIKKGVYITELITDFMKNIPAIGTTFTRLLKHSGIDQNSYCLEWYKGKDVLCMVRLDEIKTKENDTELFESLDHTASNLLQIVNRFDEQTINSIPFENSWTAAQVADHLTKSNLSIAKALALKGTDINRDPGERVAELKDVFLSTENKFQSPDFILPAEGHSEKGKVMIHLKQSIENIKDAGKQVDLSEVINHRAFGDITKFEILHFVLYHTQRHTRQLENIYKHVQKTRV